MKTGPEIEVRHFRRYAIAIFLVALALRLINVWQLRRSPFFDVLLGDAHGYDEWARRIAAGEWIGRDVFYQAPLYPYFLGVIYAAIGHNLLAVRIVQAVAGSASCAVLALAGRRFFSPGAGIASGLGLALYAPAIFFDGLLQKSVLDVFFLSIGLWLISRLVDEAGNLRMWLSLGLTMGALSLTRENALVFVAVILVWCLVRDHQLKPAAGQGKRARQLARSATLSMRIAFAAIFLAGLALVLVPVAVRNHAVTGGFYLTTSQFGPNFYIGNNEHADGSYMSLRYGRGAPEYERQDATELAEHAAARTLTPAEVSRYWSTRAVDFITAHPGQWLRLMGRKFLLLWNATEMLDTESQESYEEWSWPLRFGAWFGNFGVLVPLALAGGILAWRDRRRIGILYAMTACYAASVLMFYVFARYRLPLVPLLMLFAGFAIASVAQDFSPVRRPRFDRAGSPVPPIAVRIIAVAAAAVFANWPVLSKQAMKAITENNLAVALQAAGRPADAAIHYGRAIVLDSSYAPAYNNLAVTERSIGDVDGAIQTYQRALSLNPDFADAHYNLANALLEKNKPTEAAEHFRIALQSIPDSAGTSNNLGIAMAAQGKTDEAIAAFRRAVTEDPKSAKAHRNLGTALASAGRIDEAMIELRQSVQLEPDDADAHYDLGSALLQAERFDEAIAEFRTTLKLAPRSVEARNNLGIALGSSGRLEEAIDQFRQALVLDPTFTQARENLDMTLKARGSVGGR